MSPLHVLHTGHTFLPPAHALHPHPSPSPPGSCAPPGGTPADPMARLSSLLADAATDWNPAGRPDASGAMVGGAVALRLEELHAPGGALPGLAQHWITVRAGLGAG